MWWWIADALATAVLIPGLVVCLRRLERAMAAVDRHLASILDDLNVVVPSLDGLTGLAETQMLTSAGQAGAERYTDALKAST
jgi:hypothetical protein